MGSAAITPATGPKPVFDRSLGYERTDCRLCHGTHLHTFLDLGMHPHSDGFIRPENVEKSEHVFPLACALCIDCGHVQLTYTVKPEYLYGEDYVYDGSVTETGRKHFLSMARDIVHLLKVPEGSLVVDIGSNVGLLLSGFKECGMEILGIDPAPEPTALAKERGIETLMECFSEEVALRVADSHGKAMVITGTNVFAHIDDLDDFMKGVCGLLDESGVLVIESPYLSDLLRNLEYDTIYHQHLSYLSIKPLRQFFARFDMELFDIKRTEIHGGSIRLFVGRNDLHTVEPIVQELIDEEVRENMHSITFLEEFAIRVVEHRTVLRAFLLDLKSRGKRIVGIGAPAKGMTLLNYCALDGSILQYLTEKSPWKIGRFAPGIHLPIVSDAVFLQDQPDVALILSWNFAPEIMKNLASFREKGGTFIIPIPAPTPV